MWDKGKDEILVMENEDTELELQTVHWKSLVESGAMYQRSYNEKQACNKIIDLIVQKQPKLAKLQEEVGINGLGVGETDAGRNLLKVLSEEIASLTKTFQEKFKLLEESHARDKAAFKKQTEDLEERLRKCEQDQSMLTTKEKPKATAGQEVRDKDRRSKKNWFGGSLKKLLR